MGSKERKVERIPRDPEALWSNQREEEEERDELQESEAETEYSSNPGSVENKISEESLDNGELLIDQVTSPGGNVTSTLASTHISEEGYSAGTRNAIANHESGGNENEGGEKKNPKKNRKRNKVNDSDQMPPPRIPDAIPANRKRPCSTSPQDKPLAKRSYPKPIQGLKVVITYSHNTMLQIQMKVYEEFRNFVDLRISQAGDLGFMIQIESRNLSQGHIVYVCSNIETADWLKNMTENFCLPGTSTDSGNGKLKAWLSEDFPGAVFSVLVPGTVKPNFIEIFMMLSKQNENFKLDFKWMIINIIPCKGYFINQLKVDEDMKLYLRARNGKVYYLSSKLEFREQT